MKQAYIIHPIGGGGHWLSAMINSLESNNLTIPENTLWFDQLKGSKHIVNNHGAYWNLGYFQKEDLSAYDPVILFSTEFIFNLYLLDAGKAKFNSARQGNILSMNTIDQFFYLSDYARFMLTDQDFYNFYCNDIDLNTRWLFQQPELFIDQLFAQLDRAHIHYAQDREYCRASVQVFVHSCERPDDHVGNYNSLIWLAWCHALSLIHNLPVDGIFSQDNLAELLAPHSDRFIELTQLHMFKW